MRSRPSSSRRTKSRRHGSKSSRSNSPSLSRYAVPFLSPSSGRFREAFLTSRVCAFTESKRHPGKDAGRANSCLTDPSFALIDRHLSDVSARNPLQPNFVVFLRMPCPVQRMSVVTKRGSSRGNTFRLRQRRQRPARKSATLLSRPATQEYRPSQDARPHTEPRRPPAAAAHLALDRHHADSPPRAVQGGTARRALVRELQLQAVLPPADEEQVQDGTARAPRCRVRQPGLVLLGVYRRFFIVLFLFLSLC